jgi:hypothetical protein
MRATAGVIATALAAAWLLTACAQSQTGRWHGDQELPQTKAELYRQIGVPDAIRVQGSDRWLRYDFKEAKGMTLGARYYGLGLVMGRDHSYADRLWVRLDSNDRVIAVEPAVNSDRLEYRLWPFGD